MTPTQKILELIQHCDANPEDSAAHDELNARVWCWLYNKQYYSHSPATVRYVVDKIITYTDGSTDNTKSSVYEHFTRSLDAIHALQEQYLKGWIFDHVYTMDEDGNSGRVTQGDDDTDESWVESPVMSTMHLAWLHAVIQAIDWERSKNDR